MSSAIRKKVQRKFKMGGYSLQVEALDFLTHFPEHGQDQALDLLLDDLHPTHNLVILILYLRSLLFFHGICV